jgi:hypothetical protein
LRIEQMIRYSTLLMLPLALAACSADPSGDVPGTPSVTNPAAEEVAGSLRSVSYDADAGQLVLAINGIHGNQENVTYTRRADLDATVPGYQVFMQQGTAADRHYTALFAESNDNRLIAGVVADGGNNGRYYGGSYYGRQGAEIYSPYTDSSGGEAQYYGTYAAVTNLDGNGDDLLDASGIPATLTAPGQADRITGIILLNADFANGAVDAEISNRQLVDDVRGINGDLALQDIVLTEAQITAEGTFTGIAAYETRPDAQIGSFGGIFGGNGATSVAGTVYLQEFDGPNGTIPGEEEYGVFVLTRCGAPGAAAACSGL